MSFRFIRPLAWCWLPTLLWLLPCGGLHAQCTPELTGLEETVDLPCFAWSTTTLWTLTAEQRCWRINPASGSVVGNSLHPGLAAALRSGGGRPNVSSSCTSGVEICVEDEILGSPGGSCNEAVALRRRFTAVQSGQSSDFTQTLTFVRPLLAGITTAETAFYSVLQGEEVAPENPAPRTTDLPYTTLSGLRHYLPPAACGFTVSYQDGERRYGCGNNFTFVRTYTVADACADNITAAYTQVVRMGEQAEASIIPPVQNLNPLLFGTTDGCTASIDTRLPGLSLDNPCDDGSGLVAYVFPGRNLSATPFGPYPVHGPDPAAAVTAPLPLGNHLLRYVGQDAFGADLLLDVDITVRDVTPPVARCRTGLILSLDANGRAYLPASALDNGSDDNCGGVSLDAAKMDGAGNPTSGFAPTLLFDCGEIGPALVTLRATNQASGQRSRCAGLVFISDEEAPVCVAPEHLDLSCVAFNEVLPEDLVSEFNADRDSVGAVLNAVLGAPVAGDNCDSVRVRQFLTGGLNSCGEGRFTRGFAVSDGQGADILCQQFITVRPVANYSLLLPGDRSYTCITLPAEDDLLARAAGCDQVTVATTVDTLAATTGCYRLQRTYTYTNWCEYDGVSSPVLLPRDADQDGNLAEDTYLTVLPGAAPDRSDDRLLLDRDAYAGNGNDIGSFLANYGSSNRRGHFAFTHFVDLSDATGPEVSVPQQEAGEALAENCLGGMILRYTATDDCAVPTTAIDIDENVVDLNGDGTIGRQDFRFDRSIASERIPANAGAEAEVFIRFLPIGDHLARLITTDGCGNATVTFIPFTVVDRRPPTLQCIPINEITLLTGVNGLGVASATATDYLADATTTCGGDEVVYALYFEEAANQPGFQPDFSRNTVAFDCGDLGENILRVYALSPHNGQRSFCNVAVDVRADSPVTCSGQLGVIEGRIRTETGVEMEDVTVFLEGPTLTDTITNDTGFFRFNGLREGLDYVAEPYHNVNPLNGVTTYDISRISDLLLGEEVDMTPYQLLAADVNNSGAITIQDLLDLREVLLGVEDNFPGNNSWRFVRADYVFPDPSDPFVEAVPDAATFAPLEGTNAVDFIAVKVGDIDNSVRFFGRNGGRAGASREEGLTVDVRLDPVSGRTGLYAPAELLTGLQFELQLPRGVTVLPAGIDREEYVLTADGTLRVSHVATGDTNQALGPLFWFDNLADYSIEVLRFLSEGTLAPEGYGPDGTARPLSLNFSPAANSPVNWFTAYPTLVEDRLTVEHRSPGIDINTKRELIVYDLTGRVIYRTALAYGQSFSTLPRRQLGKGTGPRIVALLTNGERTATTRVIVR